MSTKDFLQIGIDDIPMNVAVYRYVDGDFILMDFNKRAEKAEHIKKEDVLGKYLTELFPSVQGSGFFDALLRVHKNGGQEELDLDLYETEHISGRQHNSMSRLPNGDVIVLYQDITEPQDEIDRRKNVQYELDQSEEKFQVITDNTLMGIFIYHDKYVYVNKALCELSGYTPEELYGMHPWEGIDESYVEPVKQTVKRRLKGEHFPHEYDEIKIQKKNG